MADRQLALLNALTTVDAADLLYIERGGNPGKISAANLFGGYFSANVPAFGPGAVEADPAQGSTTTAGIFKGADSTSAAPLNSNNPSIFLQTFRTGGTAGVGRFGFIYNYEVTGASAANNYGLYIIGRLTPSMTGAPAGDYFHELGRDYLILSPTNISGQSIHGYARNMQAERTVTGVRVVSAYAEIRNSTASDAAVSTGSIDTTFNFTTSQDGTSHNTGLWYAEGPSNATAGYFAAYFDANSITQRAFDMSAATFTLQGTWSATNGNANVPTTSGSGGHAAVEVIAGDWLKINGTYARAASATANAITLASAFTGTTGTGLTVTKSVHAMWLRENQPIAALNHAGSARKEILRYTEADRIKMDEDAVGVQFGGFTSYGTNTIGAPSNTLATGWRGVGYEASGSHYGWGVESGYLWLHGSGQRFYVGSSASPLLAFTLNSDGTALLGAQLKISKTNSTDTAAASSLLIENPAGSASEIYFTFNNVVKGTLRLDSSGNYVLNSVGNAFYWNQDYGVAPVFNSSNGPIKFAEGLALAARGSTPSGPSASSESNLYMKGGKLIAQYNDAGTVRYKYLDMTGTGVTWVHTTSAP